MHAHIGDRSDYLTKPNPFVLSLAKDHLSRWFDRSDFAATPMESGLTPNGMRKE